MNRFVITIQNPDYMLEVFVWDRETKMVRFSTQYADLSIEAQAAAKKRCQTWIETHGQQLELPFDK